MNLAGPLTDEISIALSFKFRFLFYFMTFCSFMISFPTFGEISSAIWLALKPDFLLISAPSCKILLAFYH